LKETGSFPQWDVNPVDIMPGQHSGNVAESRTNIGQKDPCLSFPHHWIFFHEWPYICHIDPYSWLFVEKCLGKETETCWIMRTKSAVSISEITDDQDSEELPPPPVNCPQF
jgi:hypothetical protein